ncbi:hypothetical protein ACFV61_22155, partial [Kitasatospora sp. NPDC059817]
MAGQSGEPSRLRRAAVGVPALAGGLVMMTGVFPASAVAAGGTLPRIAQPSGQKEFTRPGDFGFYVPAGVAALTVYVVAGGGPGGVAGGGGDAVAAAVIVVLPGVAGGAQRGLVGGQA